MTDTSDSGSDSTQPEGAAQERHRCADWTRAQGVDPIGTAAHAARFLLVEWPLPWPSHIEEIASLEPLHQLAARTGTRVQLVVAGPNTDQREIVLHRRGDSSGFRSFERRAMTTSPREVIDASCALLADPRVAPATPADVDVLVCTHGRRDACCGSLGTGLAVALAVERSDPGIHVRRTSHTGGHRFAPTATFLPSGTVWAHCDLELIERVLRRAGDVRDILDRYRGSCALESPAQQAVERVAFGEIGWHWLDWSRSWEELPDGSVLVDGVAPDGTMRRWECRVEPGRTVPLPACRQPLAAATKSWTELRITSVPSRRQSGSVST